MDKETIEKHNVETFEKYGTDNSGEERHICTECGTKVCIDGSASNRGHNLVEDSVLKINYQLNPYRFDDQAVFEE